MNKFVLLFVLGITTLILMVIWIFTNSGPENQNTSPVENSPQLTRLEPAKNFTDALPKPLSAQAQKVVDQIHTDEYYNFECVDDGRQTSSLVLVGQYRSVNGVNTFEASQRAMSVFEQVMYAEWGPLLIKSEFQVSNVDPQITSLRVGDSEVLADSYRRLYFSDVNQSLYYGWLLNYVVIAASEACLFETMKDIYHVH